MMLFLNLLSEQEYKYDIGIILSKSGSSDISFIFFDNFYVLGIHPLLDLL